MQFPVAKAGAAFIANMIAGPLKEIIAAQTPGGRLAMRKVNFIIDA